MTEIVKDKYPYRELITGRKVFRMDAPQYFQLESILEDASRNNASIREFTRGSLQLLKDRFSKYERNASRLKREQAHSKIEEIRFGANMALNQELNKGEIILKEAGVSNLGIVEAEGRFQLMADAGYTLSQRKIVDTQGELSAMEFEIQQTAPRKTPRTPQMDCA